ncbi:MAG: diguanylate cyclase [Oscillospiraceae bacterium]|nr:diguanylate cyclase [Oscillospiraceae bacterium]
MTNQLIKNKVMFIIYLVFMTIAVLTEFLSVADDSNRGMQGSDYIDYTHGWTAEDGTEAVFKGISGTYTIKNTLPEIRNENVLYLNLKSLNLKAYIDGVCIYDSQEYEERFFGKTAGSFFAEIPLTSEHSRQEIVLQADNPYDDGSGKITMIYLGDSIDILKKQVGDMLPGFIISVLICFLGLVFMLSFIPMWRQKAVGTELLYFGLFAFNIGIFMVTDCKFLQLIYPQAHLYHMIAETHMMLIVVPLFLFLNKMYESCSDLMVYCTCIMGGFNFTVCYLLNICAVMDYHETVWITHITYGVGVLFLLMIIVRELKNNGRMNMYHNVGIFIICISVVLDILMLKLGSSFETTFFTRTGMLIFVCLEGIQIFLGFFRHYREAMKAKLLSRLAYHDGLTDLLNRTSYMEELELIRKNGRENALIALFDVNDLKYVNDHHGHSAGDGMIIAVAEELKSCFGELGKCYRIGGDEFVFISDNVCDESTFNGICSEFMERLGNADSNGRFMMPITVAMGYSVISGNGDKLEDIINEADARMYSNKKQMKQNNVRSAASIG